MTPTRHVTRLILLQVAFLLLGVCHDVGCVAHAGQTRRQGKMVLKQIRASGRAAAGYPFLQTTANVTRVAANLSGLINPIGWFF
jgi:hypothetical protein